MRVSVQARHPGTGDRWQRSIYLDGEPRDVIVRFADMTPVGSSGAFDPALADTLLFVVDTTNTLPGTDGSFTLENLARRTVNLILRRTRHDRDAEEIPREDLHLSDPGAPAVGRRR